MRKIKSNVTTAIWLSAAWLAMQLVVLVITSVRKSSYFSFGPSELLLMPFTTDTQVDTWAKWLFLVLFSTLSTIVSTYNSAMLRPWIDSVALNPEVKLPHDKGHTMMLVNVSSAIQMVTGAITFVYTSTQVDIAFFSGLGAVAVYYICSYAIVHDEDRDRLDSNDNTENIFQLDELPDQTLFSPTDATDAPAGASVLLNDEQLKRVIDTSEFTYIIPYPQMFPRW